MAVGLFWLNCTKVLCINTLFVSNNNILIHLIYFICQ